MHKYGLMSRTSTTLKFDGDRVALRGRVYPDQHARATAQAKHHGLSLSEYLAALIDRDSGLPSKLDHEEEALFSKVS